MHVGRWLACTCPLTGMRIALLNALAWKLDVVLDNDCGDALHESICAWMRTRIREPVNTTVTLAIRRHRS